MKIRSLHHTKHNRIKIRIFHRARMIGLNGMPVPFTISMLNDLPFWHARMLFFGYRKGVDERKARA